MTQSTLARTPFRPMQPAPAVTCTPAHCAPCIGRAPYATRAQQWPCACAFAAMKESRMPDAECPALARAAQHLARMTATTRDQYPEWEVVLTQLAMEQSRATARANTPAPSPDRLTGVMARILRAVGVIA